jgi:hypothetical protein
VEIVSNINSMKEQHEFSTNLNTAVAVVNNMPNDDCNIKNVN